MKLDSARELKAKLIKGVVKPFTNVAVAEGIFATAARPTSTVPLVQRSIALGVAPKGGQFRLAVRVQRPSLLGSAVLDRIVAEAKGEVDVRMVGRVDKRAVPWYRRRGRPLYIGHSCGHFEITWGTIGAFCTRGNRVYILSNNHVLANENFAKQGDRILQPGPGLGGKSPKDNVARLSSFVKFKKTKANVLDCALAEVNTGIDYNPVKLRGLVNGKDRTLKGVGPDVVDSGAVMYKIGANTGPTRGRVTAFDVDNVVVNYDIGNLTFDNQIEIEGSGKKAFSDGGDSGALIVNGAMEAVALLFCGSDTGGANDMGLTYANPIHDVLAGLKATLLV